MRLLARIFAVCLVVVLASCAPARDASTLEARAAILSEFQRGDTTLTCTIPCISAWLDARPKMQALDAAGDWQGLAILVASTGYMRDLGYYYLGRAADGLRLPAVAARYYQLSYALASNPAPGPRCAANANDCNGIDLLAVLPARIAGGSRSVSGEVRQPVRASSAQPAATPGMGPWTRLACNDGRRLAIRFPANDREHATAQVMVGSSTKIETYENTWGASGIHYLGPPGYWIHQWHGEWSYSYDRNGQNVEVACREAV